MLIKEPIQQTLSFPKNPPCIGKYPSMEKTTHKSPQDFKAACKSVTFLPVYTTSVACSNHTWNCHSQLLPQHLPQMPLYFWEPSAFLRPSRTNQMSFSIKAVLSHASSQLETQAMNQDKPFCPKLPSFLLFWEKSNFKKIISPKKMECKFYFLVDDS